MTCGWRRFGGDVPQHHFTHQAPSFSSSGHPDNRYVKASDSAAFTSPLRRSFSRSDSAPIEVRRADFSPIPGPLDSCDTENRRHAPSLRGSDSVWNRDCCMTTLCFLRALGTVSDAQFPDVRCDRHWDGHCQALRERQEAPQVFGGSMGSG